MKVNVSISCKPTQRMTVDALNEVKCKGWALRQMAEVLLSPAQLCFPEAESLNYEKWENTEALPMPLNKTGFIFIIFR